MSKCQFPEGVAAQIGDNSLDPCMYEMRSVLDDTVKRTPKTLLWRSNV